MRGSRRMAFMVLAISLGAAGGCHDAKREATQRAALELSAIKADAGKACQCEQHHGPGAGKSCWAHFDATMARKRASFTATSCDPVYEEGQCWADNGQQQCLTTKYHAFLFHGGEALLCSVEQAKAAEAAWYKGAEESPDGIDGSNMPHAKRDAADAEIRRIARGEPVVAARSDIPSCI